MRSVDQLHLHRPLARRWAGHRALQRRVNSARLRPRLSRLCKEAVR
jgi:hypothetical protein